MPAWHKNMRILKKLLQIAPILLLATARAQQPLTEQDANAWLDGYMPYALHSGDIAGAVVAIVKDGKVLTERGYGFSDIEKRTPVDPKKTLFRPGSVSKLHDRGPGQQLRY